MLYKAQQNLNNMERLVNVQRIHIGNIVFFVLSSTLPPIHYNMSAHQHKELPEFAKTQKAAHYIHSYSPNGAMHKQNVVAFAFPLSQKGSLQWVIQNKVCKIQNQKT